jgi:hypothetical protein
MGKNVPVASVRTGWQPRRTRIVTIAALAPVEAALSTAVVPEPEARVASPCGPTMYAVVREDRKPATSDISGAGDRSMPRFAMDRSAEIAFGSRVSIDRPHMPSGERSDPWTDD